MEKTIEIPEGYEARIEGNKVILEPKESGDEKIRRLLIDYFECIKSTLSDGVWKGFQIKEILAYLERQKEQKPIDIDFVSTWLRKHVKTYVNSEYNEFHKTVEYDGTVNVERLIADLKVAVDGGTFDVDAAFDAREPKDNWEYIKEFCYKFGRLPQDMDELDELVSYVMVKKQKEQQPIENVIKNITKNKEAATKFLKSAGIMDDNGELAEMYRSEQQPVHTAKEIWKEMRPEVYAQASGNRYNREQMYSDDSTKLFSIRDIDEIFEKIGNSTVGSQPAEWSRQSIIDALTKWLTEKIAPLHKKSLDGPLTEKEEMFEAALLEMRSLVNSPDFQIGKNTSPEWSEKDKTIDQLAEEYVEGVKKFNDEPTWDLIHTAVCYGSELGFIARKEKEQKPASTVKSKFKSGDSIRFNGFGSNEYTIQLVGNGYYVNSEGGRMDMSYTDANFVLIENAQKEPKPVEWEPKPVEWEWPNLSNCIKNCKKCHGKCFYRKEPYEEQKPAEKLSKEEYVKKFKALCDAYEIKLPNREYDIYGLCEDLHKLFGDIQKPAEWREEDEQIRKEIIFLLKNADSGKELTTFHSTEEMIAWLEKRNGQKPAEWSKEEKERIRQNGRLDVCYNPEKYGLCHKTEWGEGEMKMLVSIIDDYETAAKSFCGHDGKIMFLKAIRDGEYGLSKQEWSEEDKRKLNRIYGILGMAADTHAYSTTCRLIGDKEAVELQDFLRTIAKPLTSLGVSMARAKTWFNEHFNFLNNSSGRGEDYEIWTDEFDSIEKMYEDFRKAVEVTPNEA